MNAPPANTVSLRDVLLSLRPSQWTKNIVVAAAFFFAFWDRSQNLGFMHGLGIVIPAVILFCLASSGIYLINDVRDREADRLHPVKKSRPIAAGRVPVKTAVPTAAGLLIVALAGALVLRAEFAGAMATYALIQLVYSFGLKRVALVDSFVIAIGFVLRAIAGALVLRVEISAWLLLCTFLLALFLALCKRRHEKIQLNDAGVRSRENLDKYDERLLDQLIGIVASATIVSYAIYTLSPATVAKFGTPRLGFTIPFVMFGVFRYLDLAYRHDKGDRPEKILLTDGPILVNLALYAMCVVLIFLTSRAC